MIPSVNIRSTTHYDPIILHCGQPHHTLSLFQILHLPNLNCPICQTAITTSTVGKKIFTEIIPLLLKLEEKSNKLEELLPLIEYYESIIESTKQINEQFTNTQYSLDCEISRAITHLNEYVDRFPLRDLKGIEDLWNQPLHIENSTFYAHAFPGKRTIELLEEFITKNGLKKNETRFIEYGAGKAFWSYFLIVNGFKAIAVDCEETRKLYYEQNELPFLSKLGQEIVYVKSDEYALPEDCSKEILLLCWPENPSTTEYLMYAGRILEEFRKKKRVSEYLYRKRKRRRYCSPLFL